MTSVCSWTLACTRTGWSIFPRSRTKKFIKHPLEVVSVGDIVDVKVMGVDLKKKRIQLTMKGIRKREEK